MENGKEKKKVEGVIKGHVSRLHVKPEEDCGEMIPIYEIRIYQFGRIY